MPELSRFYGIIIKMYFNDTQQHHKPHIHAFYGLRKNNQFFGTLKIPLAAMSGIFLFRYILFNASNRFLG